MCVEIHICWQRLEGERSEEFHLFQERLFSFFPGLPLSPVFLPSFSSLFLGGAIGFPIPDNLVGNTSDGSVNIRLLQLTLPNDNNVPSFRLQLTPYFLIPLLVSCDLGHPKLLIGFRNYIILAVFMAMPEAAMHEDNRPIFGQDDIRTSRKPFVVYPVAKSLKP